MKEEDKHLKYRYVFFDLDGTLTQSEFGIVESARRALAHFGIEETDTGVLKKFIGPPLFVSFHDFYGLSDEQSFEAIDCYRDYYLKEGIYLAPLYDGVREMLQSLKEVGYTLMMVTSKPQPMAEIVATSRGIRDCFDAIVGPSAETRDPSKALLIREAMAYLGIGEESIPQIVMVGDRFYDIEGAKAVGVDSIGVLYGYGTEEELVNAGATKLAHTAQEITEIVKNA